MTTYATQDDLLKQIREAELIQLTDESDLGVIDAATVDGALVNASAQIDGYLGGRYDLPLATVPGILVKICVDIAIYNLYALGHGPPESRSDIYANDIRLLLKIAEGKISLGSGDPDGTGTVDIPSVSSGTPVFTPDTLDGF